MFTSKQKDLKICLCSRCHTSCRNQCQENTFRCIFGMLCTGYRNANSFCKREAATAYSKYCTSSRRICRFVHVRSLFAKHKVGWTTSEPRLRGQTWLEEAHPSPNIYMQRRKLDAHQLRLAQRRVIRQTVHQVSTRERAVAFLQLGPLCSAVGKKKNMWLDGDWINSCGSRKKGSIKNMSATMEATVSSKERGEETKARGNYGRNIVIKQPLHVQDARRYN